MGPCVGNEVAFGTPVKGAEEHLEALVAEGNRVPFHPTLGRRHANTATRYWQFILEPGDAWLSLVP